MRFHHVNFWLSNETHRTPRYYIYWYVNCRGISVTWKLQIIYGLPLDHWQVAASLSSAYRLNHRIWFLIAIKKSLNFHFIIYEMWLSFSLFCNSLSHKFDIFYPIMTRSYLKHLKITALSLVLKVWYYFVLTCKVTQSAFL